MLGLGWLAGWLVGWFGLVGWLVGFLLGGWLVGWLIGWLVWFSWLVGLVGGSVDHNSPSCTQGPTRRVSTYNKLLPDVQRNCQV